MHRLSRRALHVVLGLGWVVAARAAHLLAHYLEAYLLVQRERALVRLLYRQLQSRLPERIRYLNQSPQERGSITDTPMLRYHVRHAPDPEAHLRQRLERVPLGEMLYPQDMGKAAVFLCSDDAAGITGTSLVVDGGYIACAEFTPPA